MTQRLRTGIAEPADMIAYSVSRAVNSSRTDAPMLVEPA